MTKEELSDLITELGLSKSELSKLLNYSSTYFYDLTKNSSTKDIPKHIEVILHLLKLAKDNNIDFVAYLENLDLKNIKSDKSMYSLKKDLIMKLRNKGESLQKIVDEIGFGTRQSLSIYINNLDRKKDE